MHLHRVLTAVAAVEADPVLMVVEAGPALMAAAEAADPAVVVMGVVETVAAAVVAEEEAVKNIRTVIIQCFEISFH